jgi:hypothetical protein
VKEFDCNLTREICELCDREADLTKRGRDPSALAGLRRRVSSLFLQFCETPEFNPGERQVLRRRATRGGGGARGDGEGGDAVERQRGDARVHDRESVVRAR